MLLTLKAKQGDSMQRSKFFWQDFLIKMSTKVLVIVQELSYQIRAVICLVKYPVLGNGHILQKQAPGYLQLVVSPQSYHLEFGILGLIALPYHSLISVL